MDLRLALCELVAAHRLDARSAQGLHDLAGLQAEPPMLRRWLPLGVAVLAAGLLGLGLIFWVAAQWGGLGRPGRFALLQALVLTLILGAAWRPVARAPLALLAFLVIGGLFAHFGQTYQTGADPWQLFAGWAVLTLPMCLGVRSDAVWVPWSVVAMGAMSLWVHAHTGHRWPVEADGLAVHGLGWGMAGVAVLALSPRLRHFTGAGVWSFRAALTLAVLATTLTALGALLHQPVAPQFALGLVLLVAAAVWMTRPHAFEVFGLSAVALGLNGLVVAGLARWLADLRQGGDRVGHLLLISAVAAGLLAGSVAAILHLARRPWGPGGGRMSPSRVKVLVQAAIERGLLPASATAPQGDARPWPVVLLTTLGAWLAVVPMVVLLVLLFGDWLSRGAALYIVGGLLLVAAGVVLRARDLPLLVEQLALPGLLVGGASLGTGLFRDLPDRSAAALVALLALGLAGLLARPWLRTLLGAVAAAGVWLALVPEHPARANPVAPWLAWHGVLALGLLALRGQHAGMLDARRARWAAGLEALAAGWLLVTLAGLAWWVGMSFGLGASLGWAAAVVRPVGEHLPASLHLPHAGSVLTALAAMAWAAWRWPTLRQSWLAAGAGVLVGLAAYMPTLGATLLVLSVAGTTARRGLAGTAALTAVWIVGAFYYELQWPLAHKALGLVGAGAGLGCLVWLAQRGSSPANPCPATVTAAAPGWASRGAILVSGLLVLLVASGGIWQKERVIREGQPVFVALVPVDPRSLMQGDYMRLNFSVPVPAEGFRTLGSERPQVVMRRDARGVATSVRIDDGTALAADELRIELTPRNGRWVLVTDAWFFAEGEAKRWSPARFGEFRVDSSGQALLVGLRDANLLPL